MPAAGSVVVARGRKGRRRMSPEQRREEILSAAQRVFSGRNPSSVTFEDIAAEAEVSRALVYNYFHDRGTLLAEVYRRAFVELDALLLAALRADGEPDERLGSLTRCYLDFADRDSGTWQLLGHVAADGHPEVQRVHRERVDALAGAVGESAWARLAVAGLLGMLEGAARHLVHEAAAADEAAVHALNRQVWAGFAGLFETPLVDVPG